MKPLLILFFTIFVTISGFSQNVEVDSLVKQAAELRESFKEAESLALFEKVLAADNQNYEANWSVSLLYSRLGYRQKSEKDQESYYRKAKSFAEKALSINSADYYSNYVMGVAMGRIALISGARERVAASKEIKMYADKAVAADSNQAGGWHMLSRWHHKVANLNFAERAAANILFGGAPKGASNEEAISCMEKAIALDGNLIMYKRDFANILADLDKDKEALKYAKEVQTMPVQSLDDPGYIEEMKKLAKKLD